jgi:hypothetical protein
MRDLQAKAALRDFLGGCPRMDGFNILN